MKTLAVLVGRFQMVSLREKDKELITRLSSSCDQLTIVIGLSSTQTTKENPLDFASRQQMIREGLKDTGVFPDIKYLKDVNEDTVWSESLDKLISVGNSKYNEVIIYGRKETVFDRYNGTHEVCYLDGNYFLNDRLLLKELSTRSDKNEDFRAGCMYAALNQYDNPMPTVDIAVIDEDHVLLGRKEHESKYRFIGGFAESDSESYEDDALRELNEEVGSEVSVCNIRYVGSKKIDDWRYRSERKKIKTLLYKATYVSGTPRASDDIYEVVWKNLKTVNPYEELMPEHIPLFLMLTKNLRESELGIKS